jgi:CRP-like cAMP-binding protein
MNHEDQERADEESVRAVEEGRGSMGAETTDAAKRRIVEHSALARCATPVTRRALASVGRLLTLARNQRLFHPTEPAATIALLGMGNVRMCRPVEPGSMRVTGYRSAGDVAGEVALAGSSAYGEAAVAMGDVWALCVPRDVMLELVTKDAALCAEVMRLLVARHQTVEEQLCALVRCTVEARLASFLLEAAARWGIPEPRGRRIAVTFTHAELASLLGSTRETITLILGSLRRQGVITVDRRQVIILQRDSLEARGPRPGSAQVKACGVITHPRSVA